MTVWSVIVVLAVLVSCDRPSSPIEQATNVGMQADSQTGYQPMKTSSRSIMFLLLLPLGALADLPAADTTIGVYATTQVGAPMSVAIPVVKPDARLLFEATSTLGTIRIHENGRVESSMPPDVAADQFYAALALLGKSFPYDGPRICYIPRFSTDEKKEM